MHLVFKLGLWFKTYAFKLSFSLFSIVHSFSLPTLRAEATGLAQKSSFSHFFSLYLVRKELNIFFAYLLGWWSHTAGSVAFRMSSLLELAETFRPLFRASLASIGPASFPLQYLKPRLFAPKQPWNLMIFVRHSEIIRDVSGTVRASTVYTHVIDSTQRLLLRSHDVLVTRG